MKKTMSVLVLIVLVASFLMAASPANPPIQYLKGQLRWDTASKCGVGDYVSNTSMTNVYLTGNFKPTQGLLKACRVSATGTYYQVGACHYFNVQVAQMSCASITSVGAIDPIK